MIDEYELEGQLSEDCTSLILKFGSSLKRVLSHLLDKELLIVIKPMEYRRSLAQNRYYWGVIVPTVRAWHKETQGTTITKDDCHAYILSRVLEMKPIFVEVFGEEVMKFQWKTTSKMNTKEFNQFKENVQSFFDPLGCEIPDPKGNNMLSDHV